MSDQAQTNAPVADYATTAPRSPLATVVGQTWALVVDAYRQLNASKLFWLTLALSLIVPAAFALIGIDRRGLSVLGFDLDFAPLNLVFNTSQVPRSLFYKTLFVEVGIGYWLGFAAAILALVSVGGIFPDLLNAGSIDLYLAKPLARWRLFLTKYATGLMFAALQVLGFCVVAYLVLGLRGGTWDGRIFLAVPMVTLYFSYLFAVCVLLGVLSRSTVVAILVTLLLWAAMTGVNWTEAIARQFVADQRAQQTRLVETAAFLGERAELQAEAEAGRPAGGGLRMSQVLADQADAARGQAEVAADDLAKVEWWHDLALLVKSPLPKTNETILLMNRLVATDDELADVDDSGKIELFNERRRDVDRVEEEVEDELLEAAGDDEAQQDEARREASVLARLLRREVRPQEVVAEEESRKIVEERFGWLWTVGTSLLFEAVVLLIAGWLFVRRDY